MRGSAPDRPAQGTSAEQVDRIYGHLLPDSLELVRGLLDAFLNESESAVSEEAR